MCLVNQYTHTAGGRMENTEVSNQLKCWGCDEVVHCRSSAGEH